MVCYAVQCVRAVYPAPVPDSQAVLGIVRISLGCSSRCQPSSGEEQPLGDFTASDGLARNISAPLGLGRRRDRDGGGYHGYLIAVVYGQAGEWKGLHIDLIQPVGV